MAQVTCKYHTILYMGPKDFGICGGLGTNFPQIPRDDYVTKCLTLEIFQHLRYSLLFQCTETKFTL